MLTLILGVFTFLFAMLVLAMLQDGAFKAAFGFFVVLCFVGFGFQHQLTKPDPEPTPEEAQARKQRQDKIEEQKIPKVFSKTDDGCIVYKFVDNGYNHYFTRCEKTVVTDSSYRSDKSNKNDLIETHQE